MKCPNCGAPAHPGTKCLKCGSRMPEAAPPVQQQNPQYAPPVQQNPQYSPPVQQQAPQYAANSRLVYCRDCGNALSPQAERCPRCGCPQVPATHVNNVVAAAVPTKSRLVYILLGFMFGFLGIHNFYAGRNKSGAAQLLITILTGWLGVPLLILSFWILIEFFVVTKDGNGVKFK